MPKNDSAVLMPDALSDVLKSHSGGAFVFFGEEDYLKSIWLGRFAKELMTAEGFELFNRFRVSFSDEKAAASMLSDAVSASPMMQEQTLVEIHDLNLSQSKKEALDSLCASLSSVGEDTVAIAVFRSDELTFDYKPEQSPVYKKLSAAATLVRFDLLPDGKLIAWAKKLVAAKKLFLTDDAAQTLIEMCSRRMLAISGEVEKLAAYKKYAAEGEPIEITAEDVLRVCSQNAKDELPFAMSNAAAKWNLKEMLTVFDTSRDLREEPVSVVARLGKIYSEMLKMKAALDSGKTIGAAAKALGMNEFRAGLVAKSVQNVPMPVIENAVLLTYETDVKLKSTQTDKWVLLCELAAKIYTPKSLRN